MYHWFSLIDRLPILVTISIQNPQLVQIQVGSSYEYIKISNIIRKNSTLSDLNRRGANQITKENYRGYKKYDA